MSPRIRVAAYLMAIALAAGVHLWMLAGDGGFSFGCRLLRNAAVSYLGALDADCPLRPYERIEGLEVDGVLLPISDRTELLARSRAGGAHLPARAGHGQSSRDVTIVALAETSDDLRVRLLSATLGILISIAMAAAIAVRRQEAGTHPIVVLLTGVALFLAGSFESLHSPLLDAAWLGSQCLLPAAVTHLAAVLPHERQAARRHRYLLLAPYALALMLGGSEWALLSRQDRLWELPDRLVAAWTLLSILALGSSSYLALKESESQRERRLAAALFPGASIVSGLLLVVAIGVGGSLPDGSRRMVALGSALLLGALAYAGARHTGVNAPRLTRWVTSHVVYTAAVTAIAYGILVIGRSLFGWRPPAADPIVFVSAIFAALLMLDWLRQWTAGLAETWVAPWAPRLQSIRAEASLRIQEAVDADAIMAVFVRAIASSSGAGRVTGFLRVGSGGWRLASVSGSPPFESSLADRAGGLAAERDEETGDAMSVLALRRMLGQGRSVLRELRSADVELVCAARSEDGAHGLVLVGGLPRGREVSSDLCDFVAVLCELAGRAIERAELEQERLTSTRMAAVGHAASGLAHDLGRPLGEIYLAARQAHGDRGTLDAIRRLASESIELLERFVEEGKPRIPAREGTRLGIVLEAASDRIARLRGGRRPVLRLPPRLPVVRGAREVQRVVENLLENAMHWSPREEPVELTATEDGTGCVVIRVVDWGSGMTPADAQRAFRPFHSTRSGAGLGLTICRDIVTRLGGTLELQSTPGRGTTAIVTLPLDPGV